ncbi:S1C family serine protease [Faecalimonas sp.]
MSMESNKIPEGYSKEQGEEKKEFSFLQETIKSEQMTGRKLAGRVIVIAACGFLFGIMSCVGFFALKPWAESTFHQNAKEVTIPKDEEKKEQTAKIESVQSSDPEMNLESHEQLNEALFEVAKRAERGVVEVRGIHGKEGWIKETYDTVNSVSGVIIADTGAELLILADNGVLKDAESLKATFCDGSTYSVEVKKQDKNLGIAIFQVKKAILKSTTTRQIITLRLGNSNLVTQGDTLVALGKPFGYSDAIGYGIASAVNKEISFADGKYRMILSDISGSNNSSGIFINTAGEVVGLIKSDLSGSGNISTTNALAISDLKTEIELLSNGKSVSYIGITGAEITERIETEQGLPQGLYVKNVEADSPAMAAGIQCGDIITSVERTKITTQEAYQNAILEYPKGTQIELNGKRRSNNGYAEIKFNVTVGSKE